MLRREQINEMLATLGISEHSAQKMLEGELGTMFDEIIKDVKQQVAVFVTTVKGACQRRVSSESFVTAIDRLWKHQYISFMPRNVFDAFVRVAREELLPGTKEGHFRSPTVADTLAGRSGDALQDLMITIMLDSQKRRENNEQSDRRSG
jgi:hypothetical protein